MKHLLRLAVAASAFSWIALFCPAAESPWVSLFDGKTLEGWKSNEKPGSFRVEEGAIVCDGPRSHLFYAGKDGGASFENFELETEVQAGTKANSGLFFHTQFQNDGWPAKGFEVQIHNASSGEGGYLERKLTGSLYGVRNVYKPLVSDGAWFRLQIQVQGKRVKIHVNDLLAVDYIEPTPPAVSSGYEGRRLGRGTFALQCHDPKSKVRFRNLRVRTLEAGAPLPARQADGVEQTILQLGADNMPTVDFHAHLKGGLTLDELLAMSRSSGIGYGVAVNCGWGFGVTNDASMKPFLEEMAGKPVFVGMQAEGREWVKMFSPAAIAQFDYVFTDSMTFFDDNGKRMRLWIKNEVTVGDPEKFMEMLVSRAVGILSTEPVDIYVNPTYLPEEIAKDYDRLWTPARMQRVVNAAVKNEVAIEINSRFKLPSAAFIKMAKKAGAKFTFGTNNGDKDMGRLEYSLAMVKECGITWTDMWMPRPAGEKKALKWKPAGGQ